MMKTHITQSVKDALLVGKLTCLAWAWFVTGHIDSVGIVGCGGRPPSRDGRCAACVLTGYEPVIIAGNIHRVRSGWRSNAGLKVHLPYAVGKTEGTKSHIKAASPFLPVLVWLPGARSQSQHGMTSWSYDLT